jgi:hypothetical protein
VSLIYLSRKLFQKIYDVKAQTLYNKITNSRQKIFCVFLRPFYITGKIFERGIYQPPLGPGAILTDPNYRFEIQLVKAMKRIGPIIGLGKPGETIGVGRILTGEESWRRAVANLMDYAICILCLPSSRLGTLWEIDYIIEHGHMSKTIFIMPPLPPKGLFQRKTSEIENDWAELVTETKKRGFNFPVYDKAGLLFCVEPLPGSARRRQLQLLSPKSIRRGVTALLGV